MSDRMHNDRDDTRRANPVGAYVTTAGAIVFLVSTALEWLDDDGNAYSGYEIDSLIPFTAYLGVGLAIALLYAAKRATRRQHRGLSLASMAAGIAAIGLALSYLIDAPGAAERGAEWDAEMGIWVGLLGALLWTVGSAMLANEPEGDIEHDRHDRHDRRPAQTGPAYDDRPGIETHGTRTEDNRTQTDTDTDRGRGGAGN